MQQCTTPLLPSNIYHVWTHANGNENIFREPKNYEYFLNKYEKYISPIADTLAFCQMPNHFHFLIKLKSEDYIIDYLKLKKPRNLPETVNDLSYFLSKQFGNLLNSYCQAFNKEYKRKGSLFVPNFHRKIVDSIEYLLKLVIYIHRNPVHHGFVDSPSNWPHSSLKYFEFRNTQELVDTNTVLDYFGSLSDFFQLHMQFSVERGEEYPFIF